jgi:hypothetical protein
VSLCCHAAAGGYKSLENGRQTQGECSRLT